MKLISDEKMDNGMRVMYHLGEYEGFEMKPIEIKVIEEERKLPKKKWWQFKRRGK